MRHSIFIKRLINRIVVICLTFFFQSYIIVILVKCSRLNGGFLLQNVRLNKKKTQSNSERLN